MRGACAEHLSPARTCPKLESPLPNPQEVWATVAGHEQVLAADETALQRAKDMLQQCLDEAAGDAAPLT